jgi:hypothetical protein
MLNEDHKEVASGKKKDEEGYMARTELDSIEKAVKNLRNNIKRGNQQLPAWVQSKITKAADYIDTAAEYLDAEETVDEARNPLKDPATQIKISRGVGALTPESAKQLGPKAEKLQKEKAAQVDLPKLKESLVDKILSEIEEEKDPIGPTKPFKTPKEIANLHGVPLRKIQNQLKIGIDVESEHTTSRKEARIIALQHLEEIPEYYTRLKKMETQAESYDDPCWKGYTQVGTKMKNGKEVPNCVPKTKGVKKAKEQVDEAVRLAAQNGNLLSVVLMWRGKYYSVRTFFPQVRMPSKKEVNDEMQKLYPGCRIISFTQATLDPNQPIVQIQNSKSKNYLLNNQTIGESAEVYEDWQSANRKDRTDGLSQKAVNAYRRENPGSKLQTAVTEKKPKGKRAKRRASFCRRMSGMRSKLTSSKTARDPDSRINKALRRWRCE